MSLGLPEISKELLDEAARQDQKPANEGDYGKQGDDTAWRHVAKSLIDEKGFKTPEVGLLTTAIVIGWLLVDDNRSKALVRFEGVLLVALKCLVAAGLIAGALWAYSAVKRRPPVSDLASWTWLRWCATASFCAIALGFGFVVGLNWPGRVSPVESKRRAWVEVQKAREILKQANAIYSEESPAPTKR